MTDNDDDVLRRSLDAVDRHRNWLIVGLVALVMLLAIVFAHGAVAMHGGLATTTDALLMHYFILIIWVTVLAIVVVIQINTMGKRILRAIELASRK